jgi:hypothetical protein
MEVRTQIYGFVINLVMLFVMALKKQFPELYQFLETQYAQLAWNGTKAFTVVQRFWQQQGIDKMFQTEKKDKRIRFIKNGRDVTRSDDYEMVMYYVLDKESQKYTCKRYTTFDEFCEDEIEDSEIKAIPEIKMLGLQMKYKADGRKFDLASDVNYHVEGNKLLDRLFVKLLLNELHEVNMSDDEEYEISFIDQEMNVRALTDQQYVVIEDEKLKII